MRPAVKKTIEWMQKIHRGMYEISQKDTMQMSRQRGIYVCQAQSFNIYIAEPNIRKVQAVHNYSNSLKLKTGMYYLRQNPASQTNRFTVDMEIQTYYNSLGKKGNTIVTDEARKKKMVCTAEVCTSCT